MKRFFAFLALFAALSGMCFGETLSDTIKKDFKTPAFAAYSPQKGASSNSIELQIQQKQSAIKKVNEDTKLTPSQKKSKLSLLEKELDLLKKQKENIKKAGG